MRRPSSMPWGIAVLCLLFLPSCRGGDSTPPLVVQRDSAGIQIVEAMRPLRGDSSLWRIDADPVVDLTLTGIGPNHEFHQARSMKQRPDGSLMIANTGSEEVRVFSATGEFLGSFGGSGEGPGEFRSLYVIENAGDTLLAMDSDGRVTVVAPDLTVVRAFNIAPLTLDLHYVDGGVILPEPRALVLPPAGVAGRIRPPVPLVLFDLEGEQSDSIGEMQGPELYISGGSVGVFFGKSSHVATMGRRIFSGANDLMQVQELDMSGNLVRILRVPGYPLDLSNAQIAAERDFFLDRSPPGSPFRQGFEDAPASDTRPAYDDIMVDPSGAVWLERFRGASEEDQPQEWLVLDADGTWLGNVGIPDRFAVTDITMDAVLGIWRDELDVQHPQVLRLNRN
ncbi:MAG: hypothetical protein F4179_06790 [Gammaproteobacteria bacterium]|nr:hypothetical protein [Gammaproteobacteria bacterium]MYF61366.1 hypothetical protein [Gammaproteobacteria bacterium]MYI23697.1 hypothetical protein [Gammaproteobacteria bacterium]